MTQEPVPYTVEDVTFANGDVTLAGTLTLPPTDGPHAVVVLVSGSVRRTGMRRSAAASP
ncbi:MAG: hypothetical protein U0521_06695 [Anaerolineae bacterium]